jgi:type VI secretion system ImpM family protein
MTAACGPGLHPCRHRQWTDRGELSAEAEQLRERFSTASAEDLGEAWAEAYRQAPILCFSAAAGTIDAHAWHGIVMSSYDRVGREFPLTIARAGAPEEEPEMGWKQWAVIARCALNPACDPDGLDQALADLRGNAEYATLRACASAWWCLYPTEEWVATPLGVYEGLPQGLYQRVLAARHPG